MGWMYELTSMKDKEYIDKSYTWNGKDDQGEFTVKVLKSSIVSSTYYGAIEKAYSNGEKNVVGVVVLIRHNHWEIGTKEMDETMGPCYTKCPESILKLLTPTTNKWANEWREACRKNVEKKKILSKATDIIFIPKYDLTSGTPAGTEIKLHKNGTKWIGGYYRYSTSLLLSGEIKAI